MVATVDPGDPLPHMPVTAVIARRPWPGREDELGAWAEAFVDVARGFEGFVESRVYPPAPPENEDLVIAMTFDRAEHLAQWERSDVRAQMREAARPLVRGRPRAQSASGLEGIFGTRERLPITPPKKWKTAIVIMLAIYPFNLMFQWAAGPGIAEWPLALRLLPGSILAPAYVAWVGAPLLSRALRGWLQR